MYWSGRFSASQETGKQQRQQQSKKQIEQATMTGDQARVTQQEREQAEQNRKADEAKKLGRERAEVQVKTEMSKLTTRQNNNKD